MNWHFQLRGWWQKLFFNWPMLALPALLLLLNGPVWLNFSLSGDDLYSLTAAPSSFITFLNGLGSFAGQYRHLTYYIFSWYRLLLPHFSVMLIAHSFWLMVIFWQLYGLLGAKIRPLIRFLLISPLFLSPIFYYHTFTISSLANLVMAVITLALIRYFLLGARASWRETILAGVLVLASVAIKETFIVPLSLYVFALAVAQWRLKRLSWRRNWLIVGAVALFCFYLAARLSWYQADTPSDYYFIFSLDQAITAASHLAAWLLNYPKGWQYGVPIRSGFEPILSVVTGLVLVSSLYLSLKKFWLETLALGLAAASSLVLFFFLSALHLFYLDIVFLCLVLLVGLAYRSLNVSRPSLAKWLVVGWVLVHLGVFVTTRPVWLEHSFVGRANQAALAFQAAIAPANLGAAQRLCVVNHARGAWPTEDGLLLRHLGYTDLEIYSLPGQELPEACGQPGSILLENHGWDYELISER